MRRFFVKRGMQTFKKALYRHEKIDESWQR